MVVSLCVCVWRGGGGGALIGNTVSHTQCLHAPNTMLAYSRSFVISLTKTSVRATIIVICTSFQSVLCSTPLMEITDKIIQRIT